VASRRRSHASLIRPGLSCTTRRRNTARGTVWRLSKFTTQSVAIVSRPELELGDEATYRSRERRHHHRADAISSRIAREHEHGSITSRRRCEPDVTPLHRPSRTSLRRDPSQPPSPRLIRRP